MNPDGTGQRQLSAELRPVLDYAVAPDGRGFVTGDGRALTLHAADGEERRVLTEDGLIEFDPSYAENGRTIVFGRADAGTGTGLGIWTRDADGADARRLALRGLDRTPLASASPSEPPERLTELLRMPRLSPDGTAVAFIDAAGAVVIADLEVEEREVADLVAAAAPVWLADSSGLLVTTAQRSAEVTTSIPVAPIEPGNGDDPSSLAVAQVDRATGRVTETAYGDAVFGPTVRVDGSIAYLRADAVGSDLLAGRLAVAPNPDVTGAAVLATRDLLVTSVGGTPEPDALVLATIDERSGREAGIWVVDLDASEVTVLTKDGRRPRWLP
jgi:hypothetical protein